MINLRIPSNVCKFKIKSQSSSLPKLTTPQFQFLYSLIDIFGYLFLAIVLFTFKPLRLLVISDFYHWCPVAFRPKQVSNQVFLRDVDLETSVYFSSLNAHWNAVPPKH